MFALDDEIRYTHTEDVPLHYNFAINHYHLELQFVLSQAPAISDDFPGLNSGPLKVLRQNSRPRKEGKRAKRGKDCSFPSFP